MSQQRKLSSDTMNIKYLGNQTDHRVNGNELSDELVKDLLLSKHTHLGHQRSLGFLHEGGFNIFCRKSMNTECFISF